MAKANRKRANINKPREVKVESPINAQPVTQKDVDSIKNFLQAASHYEKLLQQLMQYEFVLHNMQEVRLKIQRGELTALNVMVAPNTTAPITDKKEMLAYLDDQIKSVQQAVLGIKGQIDTRRGLYVEQGLYLTDWFQSRFSKYKLPNVTGIRNTTLEKDEKVLFESEFDSLDEKEFKKAKEKAIDLNKQKA